MLPDKITKSTVNIVSALQSLERRTFPSAEALSISTEVAKRNTKLVYAHASSEPVGYLIYLNMSSGLRIHKVCVAEAFRRQHVATKLIQHVLKTFMRKGAAFLYRIAKRTELEKCLKEG